MWSVYKLRARTYFRSPSALMLIMFSVIYMIIFGTIVSAKFGNDPAGSIAFANVIGIIITMLIMSSASYQFGMEFLDMKKSVLLRRIGASKVSKTAVVGSFLLWSMTVLIMVVIWIFILVALFSNAFGLLPWFYWKQVNWFALFVAIIIGSLGSYIIAFLFLSIANDTDTYNICNTLFFFFATAWGGLFGGGAHWMYVIGHITPIGWTADLIQGAVNGDAVFHLGGYVPNMPPVKASYQEWGIKYDGIFAIWVVPWRAIMDIFAPLLIGIFVGGVSLKKFKWD